MKNEILFITYQITIFFKSLILTKFLIYNITYLLEWQKKNTILARMQSHWKAHTLLLGMQNGTATWEKIWEFLMKLKHTCVCMCACAWVCMLSHFSCV